MSERCDAIHGGKRCGLPKGHYSPSDPHVYTLPPPPAVPEAQGEPKNLVPPEVVFPGGPLRPEPEASPPRVMAAGSSHKVEAEQEDLGSFSSEGKTPVEQAKPVRWEWRRKDGPRWHDCAEAHAEEVGKRDGYEVRELYAGAHPNSVLEEALEEQRLLFVKVYEYAGQHLWKSRQREDSQGHHCDYRKGLQAIKQMVKPAMACTVGAQGEDDGA